MENGNPEEPNRCNGEYVITQGVLYRYSPDDDVEEAQLVVLTANRPSSYEISMKRNRQTFQTRPNIL